MGWHDCSSAVLHRSALKVNTADSFYELALRGLGVTAIPENLAYRGFQRGELVHVLPKWSLRALGLFAVWPDQSLRENLTLMFVRFLAETNDRQASFLTPNMIRVTFSGPELAEFPGGREGGNCKLMLPEPGEGRDHFTQRLSSGPPPTRRTYTVRRYRAAMHELDIDFVAHGENGPASRWALHARPGDFLGFIGPSPAKITEFVADWYLLAADPSAGEAGVVRSLRTFLKQEKALPSDDTYCAGYWKIGLVEDEHQKIKRTEDKVVGKRF